MNTQETAKNQIVQSWHAQIAATDKLLARLSDEDLMREIAPSRNRGIYILGHLIAIHDLMLPLLRAGDPIFPELHSPFLQNPDHAAASLPSVEQLKESWKNINEKLRDHINNLTWDEWFTRHGSVSDEDFEKEPHRNRMNVLLSRTNHLSYHRGQLILLTRKD